MSGERDFARILEINGLDAGPPNLSGERDVIMRRVMTSPDAGPPNLSGERDLRSDIGEKKIGCGTPEFVR